MYIVKNNGSYPIIIRDLNLHISGGKEVDLDSLFNPDTVRRSSDLSKLIKQNKISILNKEKKESTQTIASKNNISINKVKDKECDSGILLEIKSQLCELRDLIKNKPTVENDEEDFSYDDQTMKKLTELRVRSLSDTSDNMEKNFDNIGKSVKKKEDLNQLLNVLDSLDNKEGD